MRIRRETFLHGTSKAKGNIRTTTEEKNGFRLGRKKWI